MPVINMKKKPAGDDGDGVGRISMREFSEERNNYTDSLLSYDDFLYPSAINALNPKHLYIDGVYIAVLLCVRYPDSLVTGLFLNDIINSKDGIEAVFYYEHENKAEANKNITYFTGFTNYKMTKGDNQIDSSIQRKQAAHALYMKDKLAEGDELYYMNVLIKVTADDERSLDEKLRFVESRLAGKDVFYKRTDCRQVEAFLSTLPLGKFDSRIKKDTKRNILASGCPAFYPFSCSSLSDPEGIFIGLNDIDNSQVIIDTFNTDNYDNANMVICGRSGAGKTFMAQMLTNRFRMQQIPVIMICPLKGYEYKNLCESVGGNYIKFAAGLPSKINIMDIRPTKSLGREDESLLAAKLNVLTVFFSLMFGDLTSREMKLLEEPIRKAYEKKGITMDNRSIYANSGSGGVVSFYPKLREMPTLKDVYVELQNISELSLRADEMRPFVDGAFSYYNTQTNIGIDNLYTVFDISDVPPHMAALAMFTALDICWDRIRRDRTERKAIVLDELWKLIGTSGNSKSAEFVLELFKTIRGYGGSAIAATQDITDFMILDSGKYGKGVINASNIKIVLSLEEQEAQVISGVLNLSEEELIKIVKFKRGQGLLIAGSNHLSVNFIPFETEKRLITTDRKLLQQYESI